MKSLKKCISVLLAFLISITGVISCMTPVYGQDTAYNNEEAAEALYKMGLFKGTSETKYEPDLGASLTREQGFVMLLRLFGLEDEAKKLTDAEVDAILKQFADYSEITPSMRNQMAYAVARGLVKGDGTNINPQQSLSGKDYSTLLLRELGFKDSEFKYETAFDFFAQKSGISISDAGKFNDKMLIRDDLVGIAYDSLKAKDKDGKTLIEKLIAANPDLKDKAADAGITIDEDADSTPGTTPGSTPSPTSGTTPSQTTSTNTSTGTSTGGTHKHHNKSTPTPTTTPTPAPTTTPTPAPTTTPTPTPTTTSTPTPTSTVSPTPEVETDFSPSVVGAKKIELAFNKAVSAEQASISVKKDGLETVVSSTYASADNTKIYIITESKLSKGDYEISVAGLSSSTITKTVSAEDEKITRIHMLGTKAFLDESNKTTATAYFRIYNQYNEDIPYENLPKYITCNFELNSAWDIDVVGNNTIEFYGDEEFELGDSIPVSIIYCPDYGDVITTSSVLTVVEENASEVDPRVDMSPLRIELTHGDVIPNIFDSTNKSLIGKVNMYDQYYNDITEQYKNDSNIVIESDQGTGGTTDENGKFIFTLNSGVLVKNDTEYEGESVTYSVYSNNSKSDTVTINVSHKVLGVSASETFSIRAGYNVDVAQIKSVYNKDNLKLSLDNMGKNDFYLLLDIKDEYGLSVTDLTYIQDKVYVGSSNGYLINFDDQEFTILNIGGKNEVALKMNLRSDLAVWEDVTITAMSENSWNISEYTPTVEQGPKVNLIEMSRPDMAIEGEKTTIPFTAYDQYGNKVYDWAFLSTVNIAASDDGRAYFQMNETTGKPELILDLTSVTNEEVKITATTQATTSVSSKSTNMWVEVLQPAKPDSIVGLDDKVNKNLFTDGGNTRITLSYLKVKDQYGRDFDMSSYTDGSLKFKMSIANPDVISFSKSAKENEASIPMDGSNAYIYANGRGKSVLYVSIYRIDNYYGEYIVDTYTCEFNVVDRQDIVSYSLAELPTAYVDSQAFYTYEDTIGDLDRTNVYDSHSVTVVLEGVLADGTKVVIPYIDKAGNAGGYYSLSSSDTSVKIEKQSLYYKIKIDPTAMSFESGTTEKEVPLTAVVKAYDSDKEVQGKIFVSNVAPEVVSISLRPNVELRKPSMSALDPVTNTTVITLSSYTRLSGNSISISLNDLNSVSTSSLIPTMPDKVTALTNRVVKMTDQYQEHIIASSMLGASTLISYTYYNDPSKVYYYAFRNVTITDIKDGTGETISLDEISAGSSFNVSATTDNGVNITFIVYISWYL